MHFNIQISIQRVEEPEPMSSNGYAVKGIGGIPVMTDRKVVKLLDLAISAETEEEAYSKATIMLEASRPPVPGYKVHLHRASCDDASGNKICGWAPDGPTIVST